MTALDQGLLDRVRGRIAEGAGPDAHDPTTTRVVAALRQEGRVLGDAAMLEVVAALSSELTGLGVLEPLLADPDVTDVLVHGANAVWVDRGSGLVRTDVALHDDAAVRRLAQRLAASAGRRLDDAVPYADVALPGGVRMHAVLAPTSARGSCLSLRVGRRKPFSLPELVERGTVTEPGAHLLCALVRGRLSTLVTGGTGTGKTTVLSTLLGWVAHDERIVLVEDTGELAPNHPHVVHLETRPANVEGAGAISLRDLVRQALRMRPDRLVVGEVRGAEVVDLLAALNVGHDGGFGTLHASSAAAVPARLEALGVAAGLSREAVHSQVAAGLHGVVHLVRERDGRRRLVEVAVPRRSAAGFVEIETAVSFSPSGEQTPGPGHNRLHELLGEAR